MAADQEAARLVSESQVRTEHPMGAREESLEAPYILFCRLHRQYQAKDTVWVAATMVGQAVQEPTAS